jgi:hypothetical protein
MIRTAVALLAVVSTAALAQGPRGGWVSQLVGHGCCSAAHPPTLTAAPDGPGAATFEGSGAPGGESGALLVSVPPPSPLALGNGGFLYVGPSSFLVVGTASPDPDGRWQLTVPFPETLSMTLRYQAIFPDRGMSTGFALSDAIQAGPSQR